MNGKKNPGKFTVRFNIADPRQQKVIETLDKQGRHKAQFLTDAVLYYTRSALISDAQAVIGVNSEEIKRIVCEVLSQQQSLPKQVPVTEPTEPLSSGFEGDLNAVEKDAIFRTMRDFQRH